jgi:gluconolactonase
MRIEKLGEGLGWPEGPTLLPDGRLAFVETYRSQVSVWSPEDGIGRYAYTAGGPNSTALGRDGELYVCQNGGTAGPWRADEMVAPSIQRVWPDGKAEVVATEIEGVKLNGPNDLAFGGDGNLYFTDPGTYNPEDPDPSYIFALEPEGSGRVVVEFPEPTFPNGIAVDADGSIVWDESYTGRVRRQRPDGTIEDLLRLPGERPIADGLKIAVDGSIFVAVIEAGGIHVVEADGAYREFIKVGDATTNCAFDGEQLYVTDAGMPAESAAASFGGALWRVDVGIGGMALTPGRIG